MSTPPLVLASDQMEVVLLPERGARLHRLRAFGRDLLRTPADVTAHATDPFFWGAYVMAPWCNRARPGPMEVAGSTVDLAPNFPDGTAIHGQVHDRAWDAVGDGWLAIAAGGDGWPWAYEVRMRPSVIGSTFHLACQLTNRSEEPMPAGMGLHPWFVRPVEVSLPATRVYPTNADSPARPEPVERTAFDLRTGTTPPDAVDATWASLREPSVRLRWPDAGIAAQLRIRTGAAACVAIATPPDPSATAVEPQTHGPDGLRRLVNGEPDALTLLPPGETLGLELDLHVERTG